MAATWDECVIVEIPNLDGVQIVWSPTCAARLLSENWPKMDGSTYAAALNACTDAMLGAAPAAPARDAFIAAIEEAKLKTFS
ncbi:MULTISPECIES: DUF982 domain-containing protein [Sinorhizobium]|jgi:hypothetical protein|uniref:DUF982 domain-containing protein n=1 Tax=Rhizobium meliloti TaxID=382 RepID=A0A2J0YTH0_RHIML|nr:DUF982 domain-containing protein [Sinorhizobium meliloti]PJR09260.1 hypothetical protein CEJ86_31390 [Sinorhizobium meliloti]GCA52201.1 hypothetical protein KGO5_04666 [Sinorhizobium sp. KGO-5]